ncbi:MAG TPA: Asp-tRNA(Asn)/Glu-tRNA(Gln) amidotransferase GatCAB subunit B, partial [Agrobacterium sp.]|nr:Asp-tRNA(Asn)/Glu-tRNA(Gln) amidotransferase GatCAB subunit B [Agrobacterium sp.]
MSCASASFVLPTKAKEPVYRELEMTLVDVRTPDPKRFIPGATGDWEIVIGMEVHAQVL